MPVASPQRQRAVVEAEHGQTELESLLVGASAERSRHRDRTFFELTSMKITCGIEAEFRRLLGKIENDSDPGGCRFRTLNDEEVVVRLGALPEDLPDAVTGFEFTYREEILSRTRTSGDSDSTQFALGDGVDQIALQRVGRGLDENLLVQIEIDAPIDESKGKCGDDSNAFEVKDPTTKGRKNGITDLGFTRTDA